MSIVDMGVIDDWKFIKQEIVKAKSASGKLDPYGLYKVITYYSPKFNVYKSERKKVEAVYGRQRRSSFG